jgi:hypothetical protein
VLPKKPAAHIAEDRVTRGPNSALNLYSGSPLTNNSTQILNDDTSFVYESGKWKRSIEGKITSGVGNVAGIVAAFLAATPNTNAPYVPRLWPFAHFPRLNDPSEPRLAA